MAEQVSIKDFLRKREMAKEEVNFKGFPSPFIIQEITNDENEELQKAATTTTKTKTGQVVQNVDQDKYAKELILKSVVQPDLNAEELQRFYGTLADPYETLKRMLSVGELTALLLAVNKLSSVDQSLDDKVDEAKK